MPRFLSQSANCCIAAPPPADYAFEIISNVICAGSASSYCIGNEGFVGKLYQRNHEWRIGISEPISPCRCSLFARSIILEQPLDIVELFLRAQHVAEAAAQFLDDAAGALHVDLARDFHSDVVAIVAAA